MASSISTPFSRAIFGGQLLFGRGYIPEIPHEGALFRRRERIFHIGSYGCWISKQIETECGEEVAAISVRSLKNVTGPAAHEGAHKSSTKPHPVPFMSSHFFARTAKKYLTSSSRVGSARRFVAACASEMGSPSSSIIQPSEDLLTFIDAQFSTSCCCCCHIEGKVLLHLWV